MIYNHTQNGTRVKQKCVDTARVLFHIILYHMSGFSLERVCAAQRRARARTFCARPPLPAGHCYAMAQHSSADGNERSGVTGKSDSVKRPREGHSELPREDDSAKRSREGDSELPCESDSDSELPRREGDSELPRESDSELPRRELEGDSELPRDSDSESDREASGSRGIVSTSTALVLTAGGYEGGTGSGQSMAVVIQSWGCFATCARSTRLLLAMAAQNGAESLAYVCVSTVCSAMPNHNIYLTICRE